MISSFFAAGHLMRGRALGDPVPPAQPGNRVLAAKARDPDPDLLFGRVLLASSAADLTRMLSGRRVRRGYFLGLILDSFNSDDEPKTPLNANNSDCSMVADGERSSQMF